MSALSLGERFLREAWRLVPQRGLSEVIGWAARCGVPEVLRDSVIGGFARSYGIDVSEAELPLRAYGSVEQFFTRRLRSGLRPLPGDPYAVASPADGRVVSNGTPESGYLYEAKGKRFRLVDLLGDEDAGRRLAGGDYLITYLSPTDYHRVHAPLSGQVVGWHHVPGELFPVSDGSLRREPGLFARNERFVILLDCGAAGLCAVVMVAAVGVGHITASFDPSVATHANARVVGEVTSRRFAQGPRLNRGDELGIFHLGSTTVAIFEPGKVSLTPLPSGSQTLMGQAIGTVTRRTEAL